jgi:hypothetical protein
MDRRDLSIDIDRGDRSEARRYVLFQAWPFRWRLGTLDASTDAILAEPSDDRGRSEARTARMEGVA